MREVFPYPSLAHCWLRLADVLRVNPASAMLWFDAMRCVALRRDVMRRVAERGVEQRCVAVRRGEMRRVEAPLRGFAGLQACRAVVDRAGCRAR